MLLQLRDDRPDLSSPNTWGTLGGLVEPGETPEEAGHRELIEECGRTVDGLVPFAVTERRRPSTGELVAFHTFAVAVDWSLDELILGEGQAFDWFTPAEVASLQLNPIIAAGILDFAGSSLLRELAGVARPPRELPAATLADGAVRALGIRPGCLVAAYGCTAGFAARLRALLPAGARITSSPAAHERPDVTLWWPREDIAVDTPQLTGAMPAFGVRWAMFPVQHGQEVGPVLERAREVLAALGLAAGEVVNCGDGWCAVRLSDDACRA
jgi:8-oxo-dGTP diphosphatase